MVRICIHLLCRTYFGIRPNADVENARSIPSNPYTSISQMSPKLRGKSQCSSTFKIKIYDKRSNYVSLTSVPVLKCFLEEDQRQLGMGQGKCPKTKIWCSVWNCAQNVFNSLNKLMDEDLVWLNFSMTIIWMTFMRVFW